MTNPVISSVTFDKPSYNKGDTITATVKYSDSNTHGVTSGSGMFNPVGNLIDFTTANPTLSPVAVNDQIVLHVLTQGSAPCTGITGGGCTWQKAGNTFNGTVNAGYSITTFIGTVTAATPTPAALTFSGVPSAIRAAGQEYHSSSGQILVVAQANLDSTGTNTLPPLDPTAANQLYSSFAFSSGSTTAGPTPGFTYELDPNGNLYCFDANCPLAQQEPQAGDSSLTFGTAVLLSSPVSAGTFTPVGGLIQAVSGSLTVSPADLGHLILLHVESEGSAPPLSVTGGNCNWEQIGTTYNAQASARAGNMEAVFAGTSIGIGAAAATVQFQGTPTSVNIRGHEFYSSTGQWSLVSQASLDVNAGTNQMPSIPPTATGQLYAVSTLDTGTNVSGATPGYTYLQDVNNNGYAFNPNCTAQPQAPTMGDAGNVFGIAVLLSTGSSGNGGATSGNAGTPAASPLIASIATQAGTDRFGTAFPQGINAETGTLSGTSLNVGNTVTIDDNGFTVFNGAPTPPNQVLAITPQGGIVTKVPVTFDQFGGTPAADPAMGAKAYSAHGDLELVDGQDQQAYASQRRTLATGSDQPITSTTFATFLSSQVSAGASAREYNVHGKLYIAPNQTGGKIGLRWTGPGATTGHVDFTYKSPASSPATSNDESGALGNGVSTTSVITATMALGFETDVTVDGIIQVPAGVTGPFTLDAAEGTAGDSFIVRQFSYVNVMPV